MSLRDNLDELDAALYDLLTSEPWATNRAAPLVALRSDPVTGRTGFSDNKNSDYFVPRHGGLVDAAVGTFVRKSDSPVFSSAMQSAGFAAPSICWFFVIPAYKYLSNPIAKYYAYYSTDHDAGQGGIWMATSDSPTGPFKQYKAAGVGNSPGVSPGTVFVDNEGAYAQRSRFVGTIAGQNITIAYKSGAASLNNQTITARIHGVDYVYVTASGDTLNQIATGLCAVINAAIPGTTVAGAVITVAAGATINSTTVLPTIYSKVPNQTETPSIFWDHKINKLRMTYQAGGASSYPVFTINGVKQTPTGTQSTLSATSDDGIAWTKDTNFGISVRDNLQGTYAVYGDNSPGDGHCGYFMPFEIDGRKYAYHLCGSGPYPHFALAYCNDYGDWTTDYRTLGYQPHMLPEAGFRIDWCNSFVFKTQKKLMLCAFVSNFIYGELAKTAYLGIAPIADDFRTLLGPVRYVWQPTLPWETPDIRSQCPMIDEDGCVYTYYVCRNSPTEFSVGVMSYE